MASARARQVQCGCLGRSCHRLCRRTRRRRHHGQQPVEPDAYLHDGKLERGADRDAARRFRLRHGERLPHHHPHRHGRRLQHRHHCQNAYRHRGRERPRHHSQPHSRRVHHRRQYGNLHNQAGNPAVRRRNGNGNGSSRHHWRPYRRQYHRQGHRRQPKRQPDYAHRLHQQQLEYRSHRHSGSPRGCRHQLRRLYHNERGDQHYGQQLQRQDPPP